MGGSRKSQLGVSLSGLLMAAVVIGIVATLGMKVAPEVIEYFQTMQAIKEISRDAGAKGSTVAEIRTSYQRHAIVDRLQRVQADDLDITKDGNDVVISFSYTSKIPLFTNVSLLIDFNGSASSAK